MRARSLSLFSIVLCLFLMSTVRALAQTGCEPVSKCENLWMAGHNIGTRDSFFDVNSRTVAVQDIKIGMKLKANQAIYVRHAPANFNEEPPYYLEEGQEIVVKDTKTMPSPLGPQVWIQISSASEVSQTTPRQTTPTVPQAPPPQTDTVPSAPIVASPCLDDLPTSTPTARAPIIDPPVSSHPPNPADIARLMEGRELLCDQYGLIVQQDANGNFNGGDTAQREGWYWMGVWIREHTPGLEPWKYKRKLTFDQVIELLEPNSDGIFYRHPKQAPFNNPFDKEWGFSRDQMIPLVAAMGLWGKKDAIKRLWDALPEDSLGKHSFNGNWRNFLGQDGWNCTKIKEMSCGGTADCSLKTDNRDCSLQVDNRDCSLQVDARDCSLQVDNRDCSLQVDSRDCSQPHDDRSCSVCIIPNVFTGGCSQMGNDLLCETQKAAQNKIYDGNKIACEAGKATQNAAYAAQKTTCESAKSGQNALYVSQKATCEGSKNAQNDLYASQKVTCEASKATQNASFAAAKASCEAQKTGQQGLYSIEKGLCETAKSSGKAACEAKKATEQLFCLISNIHNGDLIGPSTYNLFLRAMDVDPLDPIQSASTLPALLVHGGLAGELELALNQPLMGRDVESHVTLAGVEIEFKDNPDKVGDDLNNIVMLLMSKLRHPSIVTDEIVKNYASNRPISFGSYLGQYYTTYGDDVADITNRVKSGINSGWKPDVSAPYGAVRWYHRPSEGANPRLGTLYSPIIERFIR